MIQMILMASLMQINPAPRQSQMAQFRPCVWPNKCVQQTVAQFQPCVWPNKCSKVAHG